MPYGGYPDSHCEILWLKRKADLVELASYYIEFNVIEWHSFASMIDAIELHSIVQKGNSVVFKWYLIH
jgi:hypothetical protein